MFWLNQFFSLLTAVYVVLFVVVAFTAVWLPKSYVVKAVGLVAVCALFGLPLLEGYVADQDRLVRNRMIAQRFERLCREKAGEKIYQVVENVDGFLILRPRKPTNHLEEYHDQYWMGDPYGHSELEAENPEAMFLADRESYLSESQTIRSIAGYDYIEIQVGEADSSKRFVRVDVISRHDQTIGNRLETKVVSLQTPQSRYAYDWEDISTTEDRKYWIAGGLMRVIDLRDHTVIAERIGYVLDREQGAGWEEACRG